MRKIKKPYQIGNQIGACMVFSITWMENLRFLMDFLLLHFEKVKNDIKKSKSVKVKLKKCKLFFKIDL